MSEGPRRSIGTGLMGVGIALAVVVSTRLHNKYEALAVVLAIVMSVVGGLMRR